MTVMFHRSVSLEFIVGTVVDFASGRGRGGGNVPDPSVPGGKQLPLLVLIGVA